MTLQNAVDVDDIALEPEIISRAAPNGDEHARAIDFGNAGDF